MDVLLVEQVTIPAQILVPLVKALRDELGDERANEIVKGVLGNIYREYGKSWWKEQDEFSVRNVCG